MVKYFLESSAFIKRYKPEDGSQIVDALFKSGNELFCLNLAIMEIYKVFYRLWKYPLQQDVRQGVRLTEAEFCKLKARFAADLLIVRRVEFTEEMIYRSGEILDRIWLRSVFDLAHLTAYMVVREEYGDVIFVCSDVRSHLVDAARVLYGEEQVLVPERVKFSGGCFLD